MRLRLLLACLAVVFVSSIAPSGVWAQASVPGVSDTEVVLGLTTPLSGPAAVWGTTALAAEAWAKHVNEQGGVHGRKIKTVLKDDGYNPGRAVANVGELKDSVFALVGLLGTAILNANKDNVAEAKLPTIWPYGNPQIFAKQPREKLRDGLHGLPGLRWTRASSWSSRRPSWKAPRRSPSSSRTTTTARGAWTA